MDYSGREKRRYTRVEHHYIIRFRETNSSRDRDVSSVRNISKSGILFYASSSFKPGSELEICMKVPPLPKESIFWGTVVRCKPRQGMKDSYEVAVNISKIDEATRGTFDKAIRFFTIHSPGKLR